MAVWQRTVGVTNANTVIATAVAARRLNVKSVRLVNTDSVPHMVTLKDGTTAIHSHPVPAAGVAEIEFADGQNTVGRLLTSGNALQAITAVAPTLNTVIAEVDYGRAQG